MSNKCNQIKELLNKKSAAAPDITNPLSIIGDSNMLQGVKIFLTMPWQKEKSLVWQGERNVIIVILREKGYG